MKRLSNITLSEFRSFLIANGLTQVRTKGEHEAWQKSGMLRPVIIQTHIDPIPEEVIRNNLHTLNISKKTFLSFFEKN